MKRSLITAFSLAIAVCSNAQDNATAIAAPINPPTKPAERAVPSEALMVRLMSELGLDKKQAEAGRNVLLQADKASTDARMAADEIMRRIDETYAKYWEDLKATLTPEQAQRFDELKASGALDKVYCSGCCPSHAAEGHKEGCCAGDKAAPSGGTVNGKAVAAPRPTKQPKRNTDH